MGYSIGGASKVHPEYFNGEKRKQAHSQTFWEVLLERCGGYRPLRGCLGAVGLEHRALPCVGDSAPVGAFEYHWY